MVQSTTSLGWPGKRSTEDGHHGHAYSRAGLAGLLVREAVKTALRQEERAEGRSLEAFLSSEDDGLPFYFQNNSRGQEGQSISEELKFEQRA